MTRHSSYTVKPDPAQKRPSKVALVITGVAMVGIIGTTLALTLPPASARTAQVVPSATAQLAAAVATLNPRATSAPTATTKPTTASKPNSGDAFVAVTAQDGMVLLPVADFADNTARFYTYQDDGKVISFFVLKSSDGVIRAAFDACDVCFAAKKGYHQEGDEMVCNNCGTRFPSVKINVITGGCNPGALTREVQGDNVVIQVSDIQAGAFYF
ncbi:MAG: Fe-S-containing protein [Anaerolineae bacterium]